MADLQETEQEAKGDGEAMDGKDAVNHTDHSDEPSHDEINEANHIEINHNPHETSNLVDYQKLQVKNEDASEEEIDKAVADAAAKHPQASEEYLRGQHSRLNVIASAAHLALKAKASLKNVLERVHVHFQKQNENKTSN